MNFKRKTYFFVCLLMILSLTSCGPEDPNDEAVRVTHGTATMTPKQNSEDKSFIEALLSGTPTHISKVFSDEFSVEADVHVPNVKNADVLFAEYMPFDEQKLLSVFYDGKTPQRSTNSIDNTISYEDDNSHLIIGNSYIGYNTQDYQYVKFPTDSFVSKSEIFSSNKRFGDVYKKENLEFMTRSEAFKAVSDVLKELSIDILDTMEDTEIYAIDSATMQKEQQEEIQRAIDNQNKAGISSGLSPTDGYQIKETFTKEDDFYILFFRMKQNDIPVTQKTYIIQASERPLVGSTARVSFSQKGIIQMDVNGIYQQKGVAESPSTLISVEEALQKAFEKHNDIISTDKVTVAAIDFEYVPVPYNDNYDEVKLTPAWSLTLAYKRNNTSKDGKKDTKPYISYRMLFINAVTGEEIR